MVAVLDADSIGPVDVALFLFDGNRFNGDVAPALAELHQSGTVHIIDLAFISKDADGGALFLEVEDADVPDIFAGLAADQLDLLSDEDLAFFAETLEPDSSALVVVWENSWAARFASAVRESGGALAALQRIPRDTVLTALADLENDNEVEGV